MRTHVVQVCEHIYRYADTFTGQVGAHTHRYAETYIESGREAAFCSAARQEGPQA
jgi:hypothetical protein